VKLGLSSYTFGWAVGVRGYEPARPLDEHGLLDKCHELGVRLLQVGDNLPLHRFAEERLQRFARRAADEGIQIELGARPFTDMRWINYAGIARLFGAKFIRFVIEDEKHPLSLFELEKILHAWAPRLERDGVSLAIENHDRFKAERLRELIEHVGSERVGVCLDTANSLGAGEGIDVVADTLAPYVLNLHLKDFEIRRVPHQMGFTIQGTPCGLGLLDVPGLLRRLAPATRCETAVLEQWTPPEANLEETILKEAEWAKISIDYLKPFFTV
jgi:sugar phosphate isomerase/epimerase